MPPKKTEEVHALLRPEDAAAAKMLRDAGEIAAAVEIEIDALAQGLAVAKEDDARRTEEVRIKVEQLRVSKKNTNLRGQRLAISRIQHVRAKIEVEMSTGPEQDAALYALRLVSDAIKQIAPDEEMPQP